jgi:hypothetical protein
MAQLVRKLSEKRTKRRAARKQTVLSSLIQQRDQARKMNEIEIAEELQEQIDTITAPPSIGCIYRIMLASSHYRSYSGTFLDAHRSIRRDRKSPDASYVMVHTDQSNVKQKVKVREERKQLAGHWLLEGLTKDELAQYPAIAKKVSVFRLKLLSSHFGCPSNGYLCGVSVYFNEKSIELPNGSKEKVTKKNKSFRSKDSTWCFVQPLWSCNEYTSNLWTLEPADGKFGENGLWKIRLISMNEALNKPQRTDGSNNNNNNNHKTENNKKKKDFIVNDKGAASGEKIEAVVNQYDKEYLEVHRSKLSDARNPHSTYVHIHANEANHAGEWFFEEVYDKKRASAAKVRGGHASASGGVYDEGEGEDGPDFYYDDDDQGADRDREEEDENVGAGGGRKVKFNGRNGADDIFSPSAKNSNTTNADAKSPVEGQPETVPLTHRIVKYTGSFFTSSKKA